MNQHSALSSQQSAALNRIAEIEIDSQIDQIDRAVDRAFARAGFPVTAMSRDDG